MNIRKFRSLMPAASIAALASAFAAEAIAGAVTTVQFDSAAYSKGEHTGSVVVQLTRTGDAVAFSVNLSVTGTATSGVDYTAPATTVSWLNTETTKTITIPIIDDSSLEGNETIVLGLTGADNGVTVGATSSTTVTIEDNDSRVQFTQGLYTVGEQGGSVDVTVTRLGASTALTAYSTTLSVTGGTATSGVDYTSPPGLINWAAGETSKTVAIPIIEDTLKEDSETIQLQLGVSTLGAGLGASSTSGVSIVDNDGAPAISAQSVTQSATFGDTITLSATFTGATNASTSYTWSRGGVTIVEGGRYSLPSVSIPTNSNTASSSLVISDAKSVDAGDYKLVVRNTIGSVQTIETAPITVTVAQTATSRDPATLSLSATSAPSAFLTLPNGSTLVAIGGTGTVNGASSSSSSSRLVLVDANGQVNETNARAFDGPVTALHLLDDGKVLVAGNFSKINNVGGSGRVRLARLNADLTVDAAFIASAVPTSGVTRITTDDFGRIYLGGDFAAYAGQAGYDNLVRLYPDGTLDRDFVINPLGAVKVLLRQDDGKILVAGNFSQLAVDTLAVPGAYRLNADGSYDVDFAPPALPVGGSGYDSAAFDSQGRIVIAGGRGLFRWSKETGEEDSTFLFKDRYNFTINGILPVKGDKLLLVGNFTTLTPPTGSSVSVSRILRLNSDGARDTDYNGTSGIGTGLNASVLASYLAPTGRIWLGGDFTTYKGESAGRILVLQGDTPEADFTVAPTGHLAGVGETVEFRALGTGDNGATYQWQKKGGEGVYGDILGATSSTLTLANVTQASAGSYAVKITTSTGHEATEYFSLAVQSALLVNVSPESLVQDIGTTAVFTADIRLGSTSNPVSGVTYSWYKDGVALSDGSGVSGSGTATLTIANLTEANAGFYHLSAQLGSSPAVITAVASLTAERRPAEVATTLSPATANGNVHAILRLADGSVLVGGEFTGVSVGGTSYARSRIARFTASGALDTTFSPVFNNDVRAVAQDNLGRIYIAGDFTSVNFGSGNVTRKRVLRLILQGGVYVLDTGFGTTTSGPDSGSVNAMAVDSSGVYIGGSFTQVGGVAASRLAYLDNSGALINLGSGATGTINALLLNGSALYVGGESNTWTGTTGDARLVKLSLTGVRDTGFVSPATTVNIRGLKMVDTEVLASGSDGSVPYLKRLNATTGAVAGEYDLTGHKEGIYSTYVLGDDSVLVGSRAALTQVGPEATATGPTVFHAFSNSLLRALAVDDTGRLWVGGDFSGYNGTNENASRLVILAGGEASTTTGSKQAQTITFPVIPATQFASDLTVTLGASAPGGSVSYEIVDGLGTVANLSGNVLNIIGTGTVSVRATQAGDSTYAAAIPVTRSFTVSKAIQTITFPPISAKSKYSPVFSLDATTTAADLPLVYTVSHPALFSVNEDGEVTINTDAVTATTKVSVTITQPGTANIAAADPVTREFEIRNVTLKAQTISFTKPAARVYGSAPKIITVSASSRLPVTLTINPEHADLAEIGEDGRTLIIKGAGSVEITASQDGDNVNYAAAESKTQVIEITKAPLTIGFTTPLKVTLGDDPLPLIATTGVSSLAPVQFELVGTGNAATLANGVLTFIQPGTVKVKAVHPGNENYLPAKDAIRTITVTNPQIEFVQATLRAVYDGEAHAVDFTGVPLAFKDQVLVTYQLGSATPVDTAPSDAGTYRVTATFGNLKRVTSLVIQKKTLIVTPLSKTAKVGTIIPTTLSDFFTLRYDGFIDGEGEEDLAATLPIARSSATKSSPAGVYPITVTAGSDTNYQFVYNNKAAGMIINDVTITPGKLTLVGLGGSYEALVFDSEERTVGHLALTMASNSFGYTGVLNLGAEGALVAIRSAATGPNLELTPNEEGTEANGAWTRTGTGVSLVVNLEVVGSTGALTGTVVREGVEYVINGKRLLVTKTITPTTHTMTLVPPTDENLPKGAGYATAYVSSAGALKFTGKLGDGTAVTATVKVDEDGEYRFFAKPYGVATNRFNAERGSYIGGFLVLGEETELMWSKVGVTGEYNYSSGFGPLAIQAHLDGWTKPAANNLGNLLGLGEVGAPATFVVDFTADFEDPAQVTYLESVVLRTLQANGVVPTLPVAENPTAFTMKIVPATGAFSGSMRILVGPDFTAGKTRGFAFSGVLRQPTVHDEGSTAGLIGSGVFAIPGTNITGEIRFEIPSEVQ